MTFSTSQSKFYLQLDHLEMFISFYIYNYFSLSDESYDFFKHLFHFILLDSSLKCRCTGTDNHIFCLLWKKTENSRWVSIFTNFLLELATSCIFIIPKSYTPWYLFLSASLKLILSLVTWLLLASGIMTTICIRICCVFTLEFIF